MTEREAAIQAEMIACGWVRPMDVGGRTGTHHSKTLSLMAGKGWVERRVRNIPGNTRASYRYHITDAGLRAYGDYSRGQRARRLACPACAPQLELAGS